MRAAATTLMLVRHPHTAANDGGGVHLNGWTDAPLSETGEQEAKLVVERLAADARIVAVYTSPLMRARAVAERIARSMSAVPLVHVRDLSEIGCGEVDGWHVDRVRRHYPLLWHRNELQEDESFRWPGGESCREFRDRCLAAVDGIVRTHPGRRVVVVTHAGVVCQLLGAIAGTSCARWDAFRPGNASITTVEFRGADRRVVGFDDRAHLRGPCASVA